MTRDEVLNNYLKYKDFILKNKTDDKSAKDILKDIQHLVEDDFASLVEGFVYNRLEKNISKEENRSHEPFSFLVYEYDITKGLSDSSLIKRITDKIQEKMAELIANLPHLTEDSIQNNVLFKEEVLFETYSNAKRFYLFYFDYTNQRIIDNLIEIYKTELLPKLGQLYFRPNINRQINTERFSICSQSNFDEDHALDEISLENIKKLTDKLIISIKEGKKLIVDDEIILSHKVNLILNIIHHAKIFIDTKSSAVPQVDMGSEIQKNEDLVKKMAIQILRGSVKQDEYVGFFTKQDYIDWIAKKFPEIPFDRIVSIFENVTWPKPPSGVTRFIVQPTKEHGELTYFISLEHVPRVYLKFNFNRKKFDVVSHITERHFLLFLHKLFIDFNAVKYSAGKIAKMFNCTESMVIEMQNTVANYSKK